MKDFRSHSQDFVFSGREPTKRPRENKKSSERLGSTDRPIEISGAQPNGGGRRDPPGILAGLPVKGPIPAPHNEELSDEDMKSDISCEPPEIPPPKLGDSKPHEQSNENGMQPPGQVENSSHEMNKTQKEVFVKEAESAARELDGPDKQLEIEKEREMKERRAVLLERNQR